MGMVMGVASRFSTIRSARRCRAFLPIFSASIIFLLCGCGGGVDGTNPTPGEKILVNGQVIGTDEQPKAGTKVQGSGAFGTTEVATTDADGLFSLALPKVEGSTLSLQFTSQAGFSELLPIIEVSADTKTLNVVVEEDDLREKFTIIVADDDLADVKTGDPITNKSSPSKDEEKTGPEKGSGIDPGTGNSPPPGPTPDPTPPPAGHQPGQGNGAHTHQGSLDDDGDINDVEVSVGDDDGGESNSGAQPGDSWEIPGGQAVTPPRGGTGGAGSPDPGENSSDDQEISKHPLPGKH